MAESFSRKGAFHLPIDIVEISEQNMLDLPLRDQPYNIIGKMKIIYDGVWSYTEQLFDHPIHKDFPEDEDCRDEYYHCPDKTAFLAYVDGAFAGDIRLKCDWNLYAFIDNIGIVPEFRGMGIGTMLMEAAAKWAKAMDMKGLALEMQDTNLMAARFYRKNGFEIGGINTRFYTNFHNDEIAVFWYKGI